MLTDAEGRLLALNPDTPFTGAPYAAERCDQLEARYGARFACPALLREMAEKGQSFYGRFGQAAPKAA